MEDASSPEANYLVLDIETKQDPTARALAGGGKGWRIGLEKLSAFAVLTARLQPRDVRLTQRHLRFTTAATATLLNTGGRLPLG